MTIAEQITRAKADLDAVFEAGKRAERSAFWESIQHNGTRIDYNRAFFGWTDFCYNPIYDIYPEASNTYIQEVFSYSTIEDTRVTINCSRVPSNLNRCFSGANRMRTIRKLIVHEGLSYENTFHNCISLVHITFEGVIGNTIDFKACTVLSKASITNIMEHLSTTATGQTATFSQTAIINAFGSTDNAEWVALKNSRSNWTIALNKEVT